MKRSTLVLALFLTACGGSDSAPDPDPDPQPVQPTAGAETTSAAPENGRLPSDVLPRRYSLTLAIDPTRDRFTGVVEIDVDLPRRMDTIYIHGEGLDVSSVTATESGRDTREAEWEVVDAEAGLNRIVISRPVSGHVRLSISYGAPFREDLRGFYRVNQDNQWYVFSQMEPLSARTAFPCFDEPSFKTAFDVTMVVREDDAAIANARERSTEATSGGMRRVRFATTEPLPTYLIAIAVGPLDVVEADPIPANDVRTEPLALRGVAPRGHGAELAYALEHTPAILAQLESYFGVAYPYDKLDIVAVPDFGAGAMENAGLVTFRDGLLLVPSEGASVQQRRAFSFVMAHELAHMWFGNLVTMAWWDDLWLNEAFATWMEWETIEATFPEFAPRLLQQVDANSVMSSD
ncbi:M1 family peptidase, partial [bacterium AH-315-N03]|nr:M1 family peptidase [bacterium AH-315-N03]